jgi:cation diffusion facilitator family transporter
MATSSTNKFQVASASLVVTMLLIVAKLIVGLRTGSLAILSQAADSGLDLASVIITILAVRVSSIPPDEDHPYGHGKFESLSALAQGLLLFAVTVWIAYAAISNLSGEPHPIVVNGWSFGVLALSIVLDLWRARMLKNAGKEHHSHALEASSLHFYADSLSAVVAIIGLALVKYAGIRTADDWAAIALALLVAVLSVRLIQRAVDALTDRFTSQDAYKKLTRIVEATNGIESVSRLRLRQVGPSLFVDVSVTIDRVLPFAAIERIVADVERAVIAEFQNADVTVHWRPVRTARESPFESLKTIAAEYGLMPHNIELSETTDGKIALDYHLEFRTGTKLLEAEQLSKQIEDRVRAELPSVGPVFVHLEEERSDKQLPQVEEVGERHAEILREVAAFVKAVNGAAREVRDLHLFQGDRDGSLKLVMTVDLASDLSLADAHEIVTDVEEALRKRFPELTRIVIHAKPHSLE